MAPSSRGARVVFRSLTKRFGNVTAVDAVDLTVERGEFLTILGPSGSGKTTLLKLLAGFETPTSGEIELEGRDVARMPPAERNIGMVFQHYALFPHMTVGDNIAYGLKMRGWPKERRQRRVEQMLQLVRLEGMAERLPKQLSGGQQQRVALARALAFGPQVLLMDEPLGALDKALRLEMGEEIRRIHRETGTTVIYVTHDQEEAMVLSDRVAIMRQGTIVAHGTPQSLYLDPPTEFVATFFGGYNVFPATCVQTAGGAGLVEFPAGQVWVPRIGSDGWRARGVLAVHPSSLRIARQTGEDTHGMVLRARVREVLFMGDATVVTCEVEGYGKVVVRQPSMSMVPVTPGQEVTLFAPVDYLRFIAEVGPERRE
jgi:putative spermidine/putrescine transport system ATP-binding protein